MTVLSNVKVFSVVMFFSALLALAGCESRPGIASIGSDDVILAFGDSLTFGTGASKSESYPSVLARKLGCRVINAGVPGEVSASGLNRLPGLLEKYRPALVILCHGGNDFLQRRDSDQLKENLKQMVVLAKNAGSDVILVGVPQLGLFLSAAPLYEDVAKEYRLPYEEDTLSDILSDRALKSDHIHPNAEGYARFAEAIFSLIEKKQG